MLLHVLDAHLLGGSVTQRRTVGVQICETCQESGCFYLTYPPTHATLCQQVLQQAHTFFDLPLSNKSQIDIRLSPHFRGYSQMKNQRDWREQVHFGLEQPAAYLNGRSPAYRQLQGPNLWLLELGNGWRNTMLSFLGAVGILGQQVLSTVALALELPENYFAALAEEPPYLLMKLICYHPLPVNQPLRIGVAPHCDWSWMTFLLQDNTGGLQVQS